MYIYIYIYAHIYIYIYTYIYVNVTRLFKRFPGSIKYMAMSNGEARSLSAKHAFRFRCSRILRLGRSFPV